MYFGNRIKSNDNDFIKVNSRLQRFLDIEIQGFLDKFDNYQLTDEFKEYLKDKKDIYIEKTLIPDLVLKNKIFNKNNCFYEADQNINNYFPRNQFKIEKSRLSQELSNINNNIQNNIIKQKNNHSTGIYSNSREMINTFFHSDLSTIKTLVGGFNTNYLNKEKEDETINLIKSNSGWFIKGNPSTFTSFQLFEYMTVNILCKNKKLDDYIINNEKSFGNFEGGYLYILLKKYLPLFFYSLNNNNNINNDISNNCQYIEFNNNINNNYNNYFIESLKNIANENLNLGFS